MNINATLIIQAGNFFITYVILRVLFFKPVVTIIRQEQSQLEGLITQLNEKRRAIIALEQSKQEQWRRAQQGFRHHAPDVMADDLYFFKKLILEHSVVIIDELHIKTVEKELVEDIIRKVDHAYN